MKLRRTAIFAILFAAMALSMTGCGGGAASGTDPTDAPQSTAATEPIQMGDIHVTIDSVSISLSDLKAKDYTVPVYISLDSNSGITYSEWGALVDARCTFTASNSTKNNLIISEYYSINDEMHFIWNAWAAAADMTDTGNILLLHVTLPKNTKAGDTFPITYADWSMGDTPHKWMGSSNDWAVAGSVTWADGGITVTE